AWGDADCSIRDAAEVVGEAVVGCVEAQHSRALGARTRAPCPSSANTDDLPSVVHGHSLISRRATASAGEFNRRVMTPLYRKEVEALSHPRKMPRMPLFIRDSRHGKEGFDGSSPF